VPSFEFDPAKAAANLKKHSASLCELSLLYELCDSLLDPGSLVLEIM
jgi:uncharacterized DUF497 family protein